MKKILILLTLSFNVSAFQAIPTPVTFDSKQIAFDEILPIDNQTSFVKTFSIKSKAVNSKFSLSLNAESILSVETQAQYQGIRKYVIPSCKLAVNNSPLNFNIVTSYDGMSNSGIEFGDGVKTNASDGMPIIDEKGNMIYKVPGFSFSNSMNGTLPLKGINTITLSCKMSFPPVVSCIRNPKISTTGTLTMESY